VPDPVVGFQRFDIAHGLPEQVIVVNFIFILVVVHGPVCGKISQL
jgi:hypothetical protein